MTPTKTKRTQRKSRPRRSQSERVALSDHRITRATIRLLADKGVEAATIQAIAARAGYNHALLVHRYGSKMGLLTRVMDAVSVDWQTLIAKHVGDRQGLEALCAFLEAHIDFIENEPDEILAMYRLWFHGAAPGGEYRTRLAAIHRDQRERVASWLQQGIRRGELEIPYDPSVFGERFCATIAGFIYQWLTDPELPIVAIYRAMQHDLVRDYRKGQADPKLHSRGKRP